jgi:DNA-directed RNA polymerase subunit RPC12/RpoP
VNDEAFDRCPHCGSKEDPWFDRCLDDEGNMANRCQRCGRDWSKPGEFKAMADELAKRIAENVRLSREVALFRIFATKAACENVDNALSEKKP